MTKLILTGVLALVLSFAIAAYTYAQTATPTMTTTPTAMPTGTTLPTSAPSTGY